MHGDLLARRDPIQFPDEARRRQHQPVVRPARVPGREGEAPPRDGSTEALELGQREGRAFAVVVGQCGAGSRVIQLLEDCARAHHPATDPAPGGLEGGGIVGDGDGICEPRHPVPRVVVVTPGPPHDDRLDAVALDEGRNLATQGRMSEHHDALDPVPEIAGREHLAVGRDQVRPEARAARHLRQQRSTQSSGGGLGLIPRTRARTGTRDDDRAGAGLQLEHVKWRSGRPPGTRRDVGQQLR